MQDLLSTMDLRVAMGDVDAARIIYFVAPQRWQEALFTGWLQETGHPLSDMIADGHAVPTVSCTADYLSPLRLDDRVRLELRAGHVGRSSFSVQCDVLRQPDRTLAVRVVSSHVWARFSDGPDGGVEAEPMPQWLRDALRADVTSGVN